MIMKKTTLFYFLNSTKKALNKYFLLLFLAFLSSIPVFSLQNLPYFCGFENATENASWVINDGPAGAMATNKWYIGTAEVYLGDSALYISNDNAVSAAYSNINIHNTAARTFTLNGGTYDISFDYKVQGNSNCKLTACWVPASQATRASSASIPGWVDTYKIADINGDTDLYGKGAWTHFTATVTVEGLPTDVKDYKLVFVWSNNNSVPIEPGACVDNVQIGSNDCPIVTNISSYFRNGNLIVKWTGSGVSYDVISVNQNKHIENKHTGITTDSLIIPGAAEGFYSFFIRSHCSATDSSAYALLQDVFVYDHTAHCIDYLNFDATGVTCGYGPWENPFANLGYVDYGPGSPHSRHTVHFVPGEIDPVVKAMGGVLTTKPTGALASVRLGNQPSNHTSEGIRYRIHVTPDIGLLMMKYAVVLQSGEHTPERQPYFKLKIMDANGIEVNPLCGSPKFTAPKEPTDIVAGDGWHAGTDPDPIDGDYGMVFWRDWTTIGLNLQPYVGEDILIEITTYDCKDNIHFGYAYFTLDCAKAEIVGLGCGNFATTEVVAPDGFNYEWVKKTDPTVVVSNNQKMDVAPNDTNTYFCNVIFKEQPNCRFQMTVSVRPRFPHADFTTIRKVKDCQQTIEFVNQSNVSTKVGIVNEPLDGYFWDFGDGRTSYTKSPVMPYPTAGGDFLVKLATSINKGLCTDTLQFNLHVPKIGDVDTVIHKSMCSGDYVLFNGNKYSAEGTYTFPMKTYSGCDSLVTLELEIADNKTYNVFDTICYGEYVVYNKDTLRKTVTRTFTYVSSAGCDSVVKVHVKAQRKVLFNMNKTDCTTGPNSGSITIFGAPTDYTYSINGDMNGSLVDLAPGDYTIIVYDERGCASDVKIMTVNKVCLDVTLPLDTAIVCADDPEYYIPYTIKEGLEDKVGIVYDANAKAAGLVDVAECETDAGQIKVPMTANVLPGNYSAKLVFSDIVCGDHEYTMPIKIYYASSIMEQKWNNVLALLNENYNGGYKFTDYQWYKNGKAMPGETNSYLYLNPDENFELTDQYYVKVTREKDNIKTYSCVIPLTLHTDVTEYPTLNMVSPSSKVKLPAIAISAQCYVYDCSGLLISISDLRVGNEPEITAPSQSGVYLVRLAFEDGKNQTYKLIVN